MRDIRTYWREVHALAASLPEFVWLTTVQPAGEPVQVPAARAAPLLHAKSHRLAEDAEIAVLHAHMESETRRLATENLRRQGIAVVPLPKKRTR